MLKRQPPTETTVQLTDTERRLSDVVNHVTVGETRVIVEKDGEPVAAIISVEEYRRLKEQDARREARFAAMSSISQAFADVPVDELERRAEQALADSRAEMRAEQERAAAP